MIELKGEHCDGLQEFELFIKSTLKAIFLVMKHNPRYSVILGAWQKYVIPTNLYFYGAQGIMFNNGKLYGGALIQCGRV